ncbi:MAG: YceI-like domain, partial [Porphyrobacter sp. HL-46]
MLTVRPLAVA